MAKRRKSRSNQERIQAKDIVPIIGDGAMAGPILEGVTVPLLIVDTSNRPEIEEIVRVHSHQSPGDVAVRWGGNRSNPDTVILRLRFERPIEAVAVLVFSIEDQAIIVEAILTAGALYLQPGRPGDRLSSTLTNPRLLVEVPDTEFRPKWEQLFLERVAKIVRRRGGLSKEEARRAAKYLAVEMRKFTSFRLPPAK